MTASPEWSAQTRRQEERLPMRGAACVIEPDEGVREQIAALLRAMGYIVHETGCGMLGQFIAGQIRLKVVVLDLALPDVKGLKLIRRLRRDDARLVIIALSPHAMSAIPVTLGRFAGADVVLASPPAGEALWAAIKEAERRAAGSPPKPRLNARLRAVQK